MLCRYVHVFGHGKVMEKPVTWKIIVAKEWARYAQPLPIVSSKHG